MTIQPVNANANYPSSTSAQLKRQNFAANSAPLEAQGISKDITISATAKELLADDSKPYDFTNINPGSLLNTINDLIKGGKMSLDESTSLLALVPGRILNTSLQSATTEPKPINLIEKLNRLFEYNESINNESGMIYNKKALAVLERLQGSSRIE